MIGYRSPPEHAVAKPATKDRPLRDHHESAHCGGDCSGLLDSGGTKREADAQRKTYDDPDEPDHGERAAQSELLAAHPGRAIGDEDQYAGLRHQDGYGERDHKR